MEWNRKQGWIGGGGGRAWGPPLLQPLDPPLENFSCVAGTALIQVELSSVSLGLLSHHNTDHHLTQHHFFKNTCNNGNQARSISGILKWFWEFSYPDKWRRSLKYCGMHVCKLVGTFDFYMIFLRMGHCCIISYLFGRVMMSFWSNPCCSARAWSWEDGATNRI